VVTRPRPLSTLAWTADLPPPGRASS